MAMFKELTEYAIIKQTSVEQFIQDIGFENFINKTDIGNKALRSYKLRFQNQLKFNIAIGAAITAYSRIYMSKFFNEPILIVYYTDTDSVFTNKPLPDPLVDPKRLGALKLEHVLTKFIALGPKVYGGIDIEGNEFTKTKGLKTSIKLDQLEELLLENNSLDLKQEKWTKSLVNDSITVNKDVNYNLKPTDTKRNLIYKNGVLVNTSNKVFE